MNSSHRTRRQLAEEMVDMARRQETRETFQAWFNGLAPEECQEVWLFASESIEMALKVWDNLVILVTEEAQSLVAYLVWNMDFMDKRARFLAKAAENCGFNLKIRQQCEAGPLEDYPSSTVDKNKDPE